METITRSLKDALRSCSSSSACSVSPRRWANPVSWKSTRTRQSSFIAPRRVGQTEFLTGDAHLILVGGALLAAGVAATLLASRLRLPALVLFLGGGMLIGSDGLGWIDFGNYALARTVGTVALVAILFEGGLQT